MAESHFKGKRFRKRDLNCPRHSEIRRKPIGEHWATSGRNVQESPYCPYRTIKSPLEAMAMDGGLFFVSRRQVVISSLGAPEAGSRLSPVRIPPLMTLQKRVNYKRNLYDTNRPGHTIGGIK